MMFGNRSQDMPQGDRCAVCTDYYNRHVPMEVCVQRCGVGILNDSELRRKARTMKDGIAVESTRYRYDVGPNDLLYELTASIPIKLFVEESVSKMKKRTVQVLLGENSRTMSAKKYDFWTTLDLQEGDYVVTDTCNGLVLGKVIGYVESSLKVTKWVVCKVDMEEYNKRIAVMKELEGLKKKMMARRRKVEEMQVYEILARQDEEMADMLGRYKELMSE